MRARLALRLSKQKITLREILLKNKPAEMLAISPKATVPVLLLDDGTVIDESALIAQWALEQSDPEGYYPNNDANKQLTQELIDECDGDFKHWLDRYKYADRFPEESEQYYRQQGEVFLSKLNQLLNDNAFLLGANPSLADIAIFPFVRQFYGVDKNWNMQESYPKLYEWLHFYLESELFASIMQKNTPWSPDQAPIYL